MTGIDSEAYSGKIRGCIKSANDTFDTAAFFENIRNENKEVTSNFWGALISL
jgi:hypothetical protein